MRHPLMKLIGALVLLAGCATTRVRTPEPLPAPSAWSARIETARVENTAEAETPAGETAPDESLGLHPWWDELADQQLNHWIERALREAPEVSVAAARVRQARALAREAGADRLPRLDLGVAAGRQRSEQTSLRDENGGRQTVAAFRQSTLAARLHAQYDLDLLGRLALAERASAAESAASEAEMRAVRQWLAREVVLAYADLRLAQERSALSQEASAQLSELLKAEGELLKAGIITRERWLEAERRLAERRDAHTALVQEEHAALARLASLLGSTAGDLKVPARSDYFARLSLSGSVTPGLPATVLEHRADVAAGWQRVLAASDQAERARLERYPVLSLTSSAGYVSDALRRWLSGDALAWLAQSALQAPLFDGGRIEARTERARAALDESYAHYRKLVLNALSEAEIALSATLSARTRVALAEAELLRRVAQRDAAEQRRSAGLGSRLELVQKDVERIAAVATVSERRHELLLAWANAQKALGR